MSRWLRTVRPGFTEAPRAKAIVKAIYDLAGGEPAIDLGCGECLLTDGLQGVFMEVEPRDKTPKTAIIGDIMDAPRRFGHRTFNLMLLIDVIEHLTKDNGRALLAGMWLNCGAQLVFTPTGEMWLSEDPGPHVHRSGWTPEEFWTEGWNIWEWPIFHAFSNWGSHGAFWAWRFKHKETPTPEAIAKLAGISL